MKNVNDLFKRQKVLMLITFFINIPILIIGIFMLYTVANLKSGHDDYYNDRYDSNEGTSSDDMLIYISAGLLIIMGLIRFILYVVAIVNSFSINSQTNDDALLIVFSFLTFGIVGPIIAFTSHSRYLRQGGIASTSSEPENNSSSDKFERSIEKSFKDKLISLAEYEYQKEAYAEYKDGSITPDEFQTRLKSWDKHN